MMTADLNRLLHSADLSDLAFRAVLADAMLDADRSEEATLLRSPECVPLAVIFGEVRVDLSRLDTFARSYIETALELSTDDQEGTYPLAPTYGPDDIAPLSLARMVEDCFRFCEECEALEETSLSLDTCGYLFWLTRNHAGHGFWAHDEDEWADFLDEVAKRFSECSLYVGDDGRIHHFPA